MIPKRLVGWWRLNARRCPECNSQRHVYHYSQTCPVCYGWAAKPRNRGRVPANELVENWRRRHSAVKKSSSV